MNRGRKELAALVVLAIGLYLAAGIGMAYVAGFGAVRQRLANAQWWWLLPSLGGIAIAFGGYFLAYRGIKRAEHGPPLGTRPLLAVVIAGFGGFLARGATALDELAMRAGGEQELDAKARVAGLAGFELAVLAMIVCPASIVAIVLGVALPRPGFTWPWAVIPPIGFVLGICVAEHYRQRLRQRGGWRRKVLVFLEGIHLFFVLLKNPRSRGQAVIGMALYWGGEMSALWAATAAFGFRMSALNVIVALGTGMFVTRRTAPLGGAGLLLVALVPTLWYASGVPFAAATLGVAAYRFLTLWVPLPIEIAALPRLRRLHERADKQTRTRVRAAGMEPAVQH